MNKVILCGRLVRDPEVRYSQGANATAIARFSIAVDRQFKKDGEPKSKTSHSLNPVPCIICDSAYNGEYSKELKSGLGISSIPATLMNLLGYDAPEDYDPSVITLN